MTSNSSVRGSVVTAVLGEFARYGGDAPRVLKRHGLTPKFLDDPSVSVPLARYVAMFEDMARQLNDPTLGARLGQASKPVDLGPMGLVMARSRSIMASLDRLTRFFASLQPGTHSALQENEGLLTWTYRLVDSRIWPRRQDAEFTLSSLVRTIRTSFKPDWQPLMVHFEHSAASPAAAQALEKMLRCPIRFEAANNGLILSVADAKAVYREEDQDLISVLVCYLADSSPRENTSPSWSDRVLGLIASYMGQRPITLEGLAVDLGMSPRSLQRRLSQEGNSLRELLRGHRQQIAQQSLHSGGPRLSNLAEALGYADTTTFWRAHRSWTGQAPSAARRALG